MKKLNLLFLLIIVHNASAQDSLRTGLKGDVNRWSVGINVSPDYCNRTLINNYGSPIAAMIIDLRNKSEQYKIGYSAGLNIAYSFNKHTMVEFGLSYSDMGYATKKQELTFGDMIDPRFGFTYPTQGSGNPPDYWAIQFVYNYIYLNVPARLIFKFGEGKNKFVAGIGISGGYLIKSTYRMVSDNGESISVSSSKLQYESFNKFNLFPEVSIGAERQLSQKFTLRVQPVFRYGLLQIIDASISAHLWSAGLNIGCYYSLK